MQIKTRIVAIVAIAVFVGVSGAAGAQPSRAPGQSFERLFTLPGVQFTEQQQSQAEVLRQELLPKLTANQQAWNELLTEEQRRARREAFEQARRQGKQGRALWQAAEDAVKLSAEQRQQRDDLLRERNALLGQIRSR
ncbi:MAG: hypothetical protein KDA42_19035, partial [Planctomycetales bacterium]|nr:hypothetical protein [Planctomycetales bacterium]